MKNFTQIPNELLQKSDLSLSERYLLCILLKYCGQKDSCFPSQETLAKVLDISDRHIRSLLQRLIEKGLIRKTRRGWNRSNTYKVAKYFKIDRNSTSYQIGNQFPFQQGSAFPDKNTYLSGKDKRSIKGLEKLRDVMKKKGYIWDKKPIK